MSTVPPTRRAANTQAQPKPQREPANSQDETTQTEPLSTAAPLSAKQILQLQRQLGNQAVQRMLAPRRPTLHAPKNAVQRAVGFEFEVGGYKVDQMNQPLTAQQIAGTTLIQPNELGEGDLHKGAVLANGAGFEMQVDEGANDYHLEFVTTGAGFPETSDGRSDLKTAMEGMEDLGREIMGKAATPGPRFNFGGNMPTRIVRTNEVTGGVAHNPENMIFGLGQMEAEPQTTAGIRLDQLPALMENMASPAGESAQERQERGPQRATLAGKSNAADTNAMRNAAPAARAAIDRYKNQMALANVDLPDDFGSESLVGFMALIYTYLQKATTVVGSYPKSLFPMLGITNFAAMFEMMPDDDKTPFTATPQHFVDINLDAAGMVGTGATAFFAGGFAAQLTNMTALESQQTAAVLGAITRQEWLINIPQGEDRLTRAYNGVIALESMGKFDHGETVGQEHTFRRDTETEAPILELRRMAGHVGINNWKDLALDVFDFIVKLNDKKTTRFKSRRYDPTDPK